MKAASNFLLLFLLIFSSNCISGGHSDEGVESIEYIHQKVVFLAGKLEESIERCSLDRKKVELPKINKKKILSYGVDKASVVQGLFYLSNRNFEKCEGPYRVDLAYQLGILNSLGDYYGVKLPPIDAIKVNVIYPTDRDIKSELVFRKLPSNVREYILKAVGDSPFDLLKTISENKILEEEPDSGSSNLKLNYNQKTF